MQLVQTSKTVPPFFDGVFRGQDYAITELLLKDPVTNVRFRPSLEESGETGPHDILGFRNYGIPNNPDVIVIGDSQTYGIGEPIDNNWPTQLSALLFNNEINFYSMAVGGWAATQYLHLTNMAVKLRPRALIVAFYTGNDALESFRSAYGNSHWYSLRSNSSLDKADAPSIGNLLDVEKIWMVNFPDSGDIAFTPEGRLTANNDHPAVHAGYDIMANVARRIAHIGLQHDINIIFTIIPTRELAYEKKIVEGKISPPASYKKLVEMERRHIKKLANEIQSISGANYVDLVAPLQTAALGKKLLYPRKWDGHPGAAGYAVIASSLAPTVRKILDL